MNNRFRLALLLLIATTYLARAGDWPQILGPHRNGVAVDERPIPAWPEAGPARRWSVELGNGFAGPVVVGDQLVVFHRVGREERLECLDSKTGKQLWVTPFPASYEGGVNPDNGPRCVPLIHEGRVFGMGAAGDVHCVNLADGSKLWSRDTYTDFDGQEGYFGAGSTPIVADGKLLVNVGGRNAGIVALDLQTGKTAWQATDDRASYASPTLASIGGRPHAIFVTRLNCLALDPRNGQVTFSIPFGRTGPTVNAATPLVLNDRLFLSAAYNVGARLVTLAAAPRELWNNDESMSSQYTTCVYRDGNLYGIHGREDFGNGELRCVEASTGRVRWSVPGFGTGHLILAGDQLLILTTDGELVLAEAQAQKYREVCRAKVASHITRSLPALSRGIFYFRDNAEPGGKLYALELSER